MYLLDTSAWVDYLRQRHQGLIRRLEDEKPERILLCSVVLGELYYGAHRSGALRETANLALIFELRRRFVSIPFDDDAAREYARLRDHLARRGTSIGPNDSLIAAIALVHELTLVTHNRAEFSRVPNLSLEDWQEA